MAEAGLVADYPKIFDEKIYPYSYFNKSKDEEGPIDKLREKVAPLRFDLAATEIIRAIDIGEEDKVLEMGCGIGLLGRSISDKIGKDVDYLGIDLSISSVQEEYKRGIVGINADISHVPLQGNSFEKIVTTDVLEHVKDSKAVVEEMFRVLKPGGKAFVVIADPSEGRFSNVADHINRSGSKSDVKYWENLFLESGFTLNSEESKKYRNRDWRNIFKLPILAKLKDKPGFACAFNPVYRPGVYILEKS